MAKITWTITAISSCTTHKAKKDGKHPQTGATLKKDCKYTLSQGFLPAAQQMKDGKPTGIFHLLIGENGEALLKNTQQGAMHAIRDSDETSHATWLKQRRAQMKAEMEAKLQGEADLFDAAGEEEEVSDDESDATSESEEGGEEAPDAE
mgnify:CR=1 FL=1